MRSGVARSSIRHFGQAMLRRWAATERQMRYAARGTDRLHVKALFELLEPVPETLAASKDHRHDHDVQVVDEIRGEELPDGRGSSADADVKSIGCSPSRLKGCIRGGVDEVECRATGHLDRGTGVMGQYEHRGVEGRVVSPPAPPLLIDPRATLGSKLVPSHDLGPDARRPLAGEGVIDPSTSTRFALHLAKGSRRKEPLVEPHSSVSEGCFEVLTIAGTISVERD